ARWRYRPSGGSSEYDAGDAEQAEHCAADGRDIEQRDRRELVAGCVDVVLDHHLQAEARVPERADDQQRHRGRRERVREITGDGGVGEIGQQQDRADQPQHEDQVADRGEALEQPVVHTLVRRAQPAHAADRGSVTHRSSPQRSSRAAQNAAVSAMPMIGEATDQALLMPSSYPAPTSSTKWRRPEVMWLKKAQERPTSTT